MVVTSKMPGSVRGRSKKYGFWSAAAILAAANFAYGAAVNFTWTGGGSPINVWDLGSDTNWTSGSGNVAWTNNTTVTTPNLAFFNTSAATVTVNSAILVNTITFNTSNWTLLEGGGGSLTFGSTASGKTLSLVATTGTDIVDANLIDSTSSKLSVSGAGTITLGGTNTYVGATAVTSGNLVLDFSQGQTNTPTSNILYHGVGTPGAVTLNTGTLTVMGSSTGATSQTLGNLTIGGGMTNISEIQNGTPQNTLITFGTMTRTASAGATVNFTETGTQTTLNGITDTTVTMFNGVLTTAATAAGVVYATVNQTDWASRVITAGSQNIVPLASYSSSYTTATNVDVGMAGGTPGAIFTVNTLRFSGTTSLTLAAGTSTVSAGGILVTSNVTTPLTMGGGTIAPGTGNEIVLFNYSTGGGSFALNAPIAGTTNKLTISGTGLTTLGASNTLGLLSVNGGTLDLSGNSQNVGGFEGVGTITNSGVAATLTTSTTSNFSGLLTDAGSGNALALTVSGGTLTLSNTNNAYHGVTTIASTATVNATGEPFGSNEVDLAGTIGGYAGTITNTIYLGTSAGGNGGTFTTTATLSGVLHDAHGSASGNSLIVTGSGNVVTLTNTSNDYSGGTVITGAGNESDTVLITLDSQLGAVPASPTAGANNITLRGTIQNAVLRFDNNMTLNANRGIALGSSGSGTSASTGGTLDVDNGFNVVYKGIIKDEISGTPGTLVVNTITGGQAGTLILGGQSTYTGGTVIIGGTSNGALLLSVGDSGGFGPLGAVPASPTPNNVQLTAGKADFGVDASAGADVSLDPNRGILLKMNDAQHTAATTGTLVNNSIHNFIINGTLTADATLNPAGATEDTLAFTGVGNITINTAPSLNVIITDSNTATVNFNSGATLSGTVSVTSTGTLLFNAASTFNGNVSTTTGTINFASAGNTFNNTNPTFTVTNNGTIKIAGDGSLGAAPLTPTPDIFLDSSTTSNGVAGNGVLEFTANTTLNANRTIVIGSTSANAYTGTLSVDSGVTVHYDGVITSQGSPTASFVMNGAGTLYIGGANTYTGTSTVAGGTLILEGGSNRLPTADLLNTTGGTLDLDGLNQQVVRLTGTGGTITNNGGGTSIFSVVGAGANRGNADTFAGSIQNGSGVVAVVYDINHGGIAEVPAEILTGSSNYSGGTTLTSGTLRVANTSGSATGIGSVTLNSGTLTSLPTGSGGGGIIAGTVIGGSGAHSITPGNAGAIGTLSIGDLTTNSNTTLGFDLTSTSVGDQIVISSPLAAFSIGAGTTLAVNFTAVPASGGSYHLFDFTGLGAAPSVPSNLSAGLTVTGGGAFTYTLVDDGAFIDLFAPGGGGVPAGSGVWKNGSNDGKWTTNTGVNNNWATGIPNGIDQVATFDGTVLNGPGTVDLNGNQTVGGLILNTASVGYTLGLPSTTNTLTLQTSTGNASISVGGAASHTINALVNLASNTNVSFTAGGSLNLVGAVSGTGSLNLSGTGTLKLSAAAGNTYTGTNVSGGNLIVANTSGSATGSSNVVMTGGTLGGGGIISGTVNASSGTQTLFPSATLSSTSTGTLTVGGLTTGSGTTLQFNLVTPGNALNSTVSNSDAIMVTGANGLTLNGGTVNLTNHATGAASLGFYKVIAYSGAIGGTGLSSLTLPATVANVEYTFDTTHDAGFVDIHRGFAGDVDDSGFVDINDLAILAAHWQQTGGWAQGNFLNDPLVDINDLAILAANWQTGITSFGEAADSLSGTSESFQQAVAGIVFGGVSSVPEPTSLALLGMGAVGLLVRRRRR